jgi:hypothetical protein
MIKKDMSTLAQAFVEYRNYNLELNGIRKQADFWDTAGDALGQAGDYVAKNPWAQGALGGAALGGATGLFSPTQGSVLRNALIGSGLGAGIGAGYQYGPDLLNAYRRHQALETGIDPNPPGLADPTDVEAALKADAHAKDPARANDWKGGVPAAAAFGPGGKFQMAAPKQPNDSPPSAREHNAKVLTGMAQKTNNSRAYTALKPLVGGLGILGKDPDDMTREERAVYDGFRGLQRSVAPNEFALGSLSGKNTGVGSNWLGNLQGAVNDGGRPIERISSRFTNWRNAPSENAQQMQQIAQTLRMLQQNNAEAQRQYAP